MTDIDKDWYTYLTEDFKLDRSSYRVDHRAVFDCPSCGGTRVCRVNNIKAKIKNLGYYECSGCRKSKGMAKARELRWKNKTGSPKKDSPSRD